jgi:competence protein ComEC
MRFDPIACGCLALVCGGLASAAPMPATLAALSVAALCARRLGLLKVIALAVPFAFGAWRAETVVQEFKAEWLAARGLLGAPQRCTGRAVVASSPSWARDRLGYTAELRALDCEGRIVAGPLQARLYGGGDDLARGDELEVLVQLGSVELFRNFELPDPFLRAARRDAVVSGSALSVVRSAQGTGPRAWLDRARAHARRRIEATFSPGARAMARALVLGENDLSAEEALEFRQSGLSHMLAVSGTHLVFAVLSLVQALVFVLVRVQRLSAGRDVARGAALIGAGLALVYADFAGGSGSAWRAAWMLTAVLLARALGRRPCAVRALGLSLGVGALVDPLIAFDISFLLSAAATAGLLWLGQPLASRCRAIRWGALRYLALGVTATVSSMLACAPLLALLGAELSLAGIVANLLAAPFGELVALPLCLAHSLLARWPALEQGVAWVASGALLVVKGIAQESAAASWARFAVIPPSAWQLAVLSFACFAIFQVRGAQRIVVGLGCALALYALEHAAARAGRPLGELRVTALDVGQGDATLIDAPDGRLLLVDAGGLVGSPVDPGASVIVPLLRERRRRRLDVAVLTHPHPDHFGGFAAVLGEVSVGEFWDTGQGEREGAGRGYAELLRGLRSRGIPIRRPSELCGKVQRFGGAHIEVLAPCPAYQPGFSANDNSFVLRVTFGNKSVLLTGDAEAHQEAELLARYAGDRRFLLRADLLKVGHHGSRSSSTPEFLAAVRPELATISSGVRNRFGHPHAITLERLRAAGTRALCVDRLGSVEWSTTGEHARLSVWSKSAD